MDPKTAEELIAMALDSKVDDEFFSAALDCYVPGAGSGHERLLYTMAIHRPKAILQNGIDPKKATRTASLLHHLELKSHSRIAS